MEAHPNRSDLEESADAVGYQHRHLVRRHIVLGRCDDWLASQGTARLSAHIHPDHTASNAVAAKFDLDSTGKLDDEGEMTWK